MRGNLGRFFRSFVLLGLSMVLLGLVAATPALGDLPLGTGQRLAPVQPSSSWIGLYVPGSPQDMAPIDAAEAETGVHAQVINFFISDSEGFPQSRCQAVAEHGSTPLVTWEFWSIDPTGLSAITNGSKDAYIADFADDAKAYGEEVWVRPFHEMNIVNYPWGVGAGGNSGPELIAAWRHIHDIFVAEGATKVKFVWCANVDSVPNTPANAISAYWPGDAYVDYAALDGYNFGTTQSWSTWRSFADVFGSAYSTVAGLTSRPIFVAETSSVEQGGSKAAWIGDMFNAIPNQFSRLVGVCWFDAAQTNDWRIDSSATSASAFRGAAVAGFQP
jgi:beta-mannanase